MKFRHRRHRWWPVVVAGTAVLVGGCGSSGSSGAAGVTGRSGLVPDGPGMAPDGPVVTLPGPRAEILRDAWGAPHVFSATDEGAVFGMAWALAEDDWPLIERNYLNALGRAAEVEGADALPLDWMARALEIARHSIAEYEAAPPRMRGLLDAFSAGLNGWLDAYPGERVLTRVEPWYPLALIRFKYYELEFLGYAGLENEHWERLMRDGWPVGEPTRSGTWPPGSDDALGAGAATQAHAGAPSTPEADAPTQARARAPAPPFRASRYDALGDRPFGSNQVALGPSRTASGHAMLLINPHQSFVGVQRYAEIHLHSAETLRFSGLTVFGFLLPYMGHNERLGWAYTDNYADHSDLYAETFDDPARPLAYRYGTGYREAETWVDTIRVRTGDTLRGHPYRFWRTHHGPIVGMDERGRPLAVRMARYEEGGWFTQWDAMIRARDMAEWRTAMSTLSVAYMNVMYADADGNIAYIYGSAVPRRDAPLDSGFIVDGSDPRTEWGSFHALDELPQLTNPPSGWLVNTNSTPFTATVGVLFDRADFPPYMVGDETHNARTVSAHRLLGPLRDVDFDEFARIVWDTRLSVADSIVAGFVGELATLDSIRDVNGEPPAFLTASVERELGAAVARLRAWDGVADVESVETTWLVLATERRMLARDTAPSELARLRALAGTIASLQQRHGRADVPWGQLNRLQRPLTISPGELDTTRASLAVGGASGALGSFFVFNTQPFGAVEPRLGVHGNSFVKVIEFGPRVRARSILNFGQSGDPASPHFFDQAALYAQRKFKPAYFHEDDVRRNATRRYEVGS